MKPTTAVLIIIVFIAGFIFGGLTTTMRGRTTTLTEFMTTTVQETTSIVITSLTTVTETMHETYTITRVVGDQYGVVSRVCFSRPERCDTIIAEVLATAKQYVYVAVYSLTSDSLADALIELKDRGVEVKVVIEEQQANVRGSEYNRLRSAGLDVRVDGNSGLMHHKFVVIDDRVVITGSYNWSMAAENENDENLVVIHGEEVAKLYRDEFERVWNEAR